MTFTVEQFEFYLCILARITAFLYTAPIFNLRNIPQRVKLLFAMLLSFLLFEILPYEPLSYFTSVGYTVLIGKEVLAGLIMGFIANISFQILSFSGRLMDMEIGFSMVTEFDPLTNNQVTITANFYTYAVTLMFLVTDMHQIVLRAICDSFQLIPVGTTIIHSEIYTSMLDFLKDFFILGFRIILPMFATILIINIVLGILAKVAPQMNMFVIGLQLKVLVGLTVLIFMIGMLPYVTDFILEETVEMMKRAVSYLR